MKGKIFSVLLTLCLLFTLIPTTVFAADMKTLEFNICETNSGDSITGAEGTVSIVRDEEVIQTVDIVEADGYYTAQIDVSNLLETDSVLVDCSAERYHAPLEEDTYFEGYIGEWASRDYTVNSMEEVIIVYMEAWSEDAITITDNYSVYYVGENEVQVNYYAGPWDEALFLEALTYVGDGETLSSVSIGDVMEATFGVPKLSAEVMSAISKWNPELWYVFSSAVEGGYYEGSGFADFGMINGNEALEITLGKTANDSIKKELEAENITSGYLAMNISGDAVFTGLELMFGLTEDLQGVLTIPEENFEELAGGIGKEGSAEKFIYKYDAKKNIFSLCGTGTYTYIESTEIGDGIKEYLLQINTNSSEVETVNVITEAGNYIITNETLPLHMTVESTNTVENINASMTTEEVTKTVTDAIAYSGTNETVEVVLPKAMNIGADAMKKASETETPIVIAVEKTDDNSYVNWSFAKIDNPVEFNPSVHVDATVEAVDTKLAAVELPSTLKMTTISFEFEGTLPGEAKVTLDMANSDLGITNTAEGAVVYLYYYNPTTNIFELIDESAVTDGYVTFSMTHCSDYVVTSEKLPSSATTQQTPPVNTGDGGSGTTDDTTTDNATTDNSTTNNTVTSPNTGEGNVVVWCAVLMLVCVAVVALRKRIIK